MARRGDWYTPPPGRASGGKVGSASYALQFNPPVEPEECLLMLLIVVLGPFVLKSLLYSDAATASDV